jgi:hypothetical protein
VEPKRSMIAVFFIGAVAFLLCGGGLARGQACSWHVVKTIPGADLAAVVASNGEVWAAGVNGDALLVERWDGHQWATLPAPWPRIFPAAAGTVGRQPSVELAVTPAGEVWIAATVVSSDYAESRVIARWEGDSWQRLPRPALSLPSSYYTALAPDGARGIWAFGAMLDPSSQDGPEVPFAEHWDGSKWHLKLIHDPDLTPTDGAAAVNAAVAISPRNAWAIGAACLGCGELINTEPRAWHWDGRTWRAVSIEDPCAAGDGMTSITAAAPGKLWASGMALGDQCDYPWGFVENLSDGSWVVVPDRGTAVGSLFGIAATSSSDIWAVGDRIEHWNGRRWRRRCRPTSALPERDSGRADRDGRSCARRPRPNTARRSRDMTTRTDHRS